MGTCTLAPLNEIVGWVQRAHSPYESIILLPPNTHSPKPFRNLSLRTGPLNGQQTKDF